MLVSQLCRGVSWWEGIKLWRAVFGRRHEGTSPVARLAQLAESLQEIEPERRLELAEETEQLQQEIVAVIEHAEQPGDLADRVAAAEALGRLGDPRCSGPLPLMVTIGDDLAFSAAHFITLDDNTCESIHGHDFRLRAEVSGPLGEHHYVVDFIALRDTMLALAKEWDHRVLLPTGHPTIHVQSDSAEVEVTSGDRRWLFPASDCVLLPVPNTTTERLAEYLGQQLCDRLVSQYGGPQLRVCVELEEGNGFSAGCKISGDQTPDG